MTNNNQSKFTWEMLGDLELGRPNLGQSVDVSIYRLMQYTIKDVLETELGPEKADLIFYRAGELAGREFYRNMISPTEDFDKFIDELQHLLREMKIGILRIESVDREKSEITLTLAEDLDCSGLPVQGEEICTYDEGFFSGLFFEHTGEKFSVKEIDCWCTGDRVCRFRALRQDKNL